MRSTCVALLTLVLLAPVRASACDGDCNGDGRVAVDELVLAVQIALDGMGVERCRAVDRDGDGSVPVSELIAAVGAALNGCPTPTPTPDPCAGVAAFPGVPATTVLIADGLEHPVHISAPPLDSNRLFIVEQAGRVRIVKDGTLLDDPFLAIEERVSCCGERGLLSVAFHPRFAINGRFFVDYTDSGGNTVIARYQVGADAEHADPDSERVLLSIDQPFANHNGGQLAFGPDGYLYVGMGDGGSGGDPSNNAQSDASLLGKLLRLDVDVEAPPYHAVPPDNPHAERGDPFGLVWAKGLRNPWRFSFDRATNDLYIADVGQDRFEEIDVQPAASHGGENYGWRIFEGNACYNPAPLSRCPDPAAGLTFPVLQYGHASGCSVTGGFVYRGCALPDLRGQYFFSDYCTPFLQTFALVDGVVTGLQDRTAALAPGGGHQIDSVVSFGEDGRGELYIADYDGEVYEVVPASACAAGASSFTRIQQAVFANHSCTADACHGSAQSGGLDLRADVSYDNLVEVPSNLDPTRKRIVRGDPEQSILFLKLAAKTLPDQYSATQLHIGTVMPLGPVPALSRDELEAVRLWIAGAAPRSGSVPGVGNRLPGCTPTPQPSSP